MGRNPSRELRDRLERTNSVHWMGFLPSLEEFWSSVSCVLAPLVEGAGVQIKLLEAIARGVPVCTNPAAVARLHPSLRQGAHFLSVSDDPRDWVQALGALRNRPGTNSARPPGALDGAFVYDFLRAPQLTDPPTMPGSY